MAGGYGGRQSPRRTSIASTSASVSWPKSAYHSPTLRNRRVVTKVTTSPFSFSMASTAGAAATGTARTGRAAPRARTARSAARAVTPVASPSSTTMTGPRPGAPLGPRGPRVYTATRRASSARSRATTPARSLGQAHPAEHLRVEVGLGRAPGPVLRDRAEAELRRRGMADLPHHEHVERRAQRARHAGRDRDSAPRDGEDDGRPPGGSGSRRRDRHQPPRSGSWHWESPRNSRSAAPSSTPASVRSLKAGGPDGAASRRAGGLPISAAGIPGGRGQ